MIETDWLKSPGGEQMLEFVADRLSPRQWRFLTCGLVRRVWDLLPEGPLREAVDWVELHPDDPINAATRNKWAAKLAPTVDPAAEHAEAEMRTIVKSADPDSGHQPPGSGPDPDEVPPSRVLFDAASRHAANAVAVYITAARSAAQAISNVFLDPGEDSFAVIQAEVQEALTQKAQATHAQNNALKLKALGDEFADNYNPKTERLDRSKALAHVTRIEEAILDPEKVERGIQKHIARLLLEVVGNPFHAVRFEPSWRTSTAKAVAQGIFKERAFDRLPILADALLDADCDEEAILRHCRGTELHLKETKEAQPHIRGCWVVEMVLGRWKPLPKPKAGKTKPKRKPDWLDVDFDEPGLRGDDKLA